MKTLQFGEQLLKPVDRSAIDALVERDMRARWMRAELRIVDFMRRTGLKLDEIQLIYIQRTGESYPQWKWAANLVPVVSAPCD